MRARFYHTCGALRAALLLGLLALPGAAQSPPRNADWALRGLRSEQRERRREVYEALASAQVHWEGERVRDRLAGELHRRLRGKPTPEERALIARGLSRLGGEESFLLLARYLFKERDDRALDGLWEAFGRAPPGLAVLLGERLEKSKDPLERAVLIGALARMRAPLARRLVQRHARLESDPCPQAAALQGLVHQRERDTLPILIDALDSDDAGMRAAALESLTRLTGQTLGRDRARWQKWWDNEGKHAAAPIATPPEGKPVRYAHEAPDDPNPPYWFDIPVRGKRVVFVYDVSASMRYKLPTAYKELSNAVKGLHSAHSFEVVFFHERVLPWRGRLSRADPVTKELLVRRLDELEIKSYTNLYDAIETALALGPDELFVISDGLPNRGKRRVPKRILEALLKLNVRRIPIHTVSVVRNVDGDEHIALLRDIAAQHRGRHVARHVE